MKTLKYPEGHIHLNQPLLNQIDQLASAIFSGKRYEEYTDTEKGYDAKGIIGLLIDLENRKKIRFCDKTIYDIHER